MVRAFCLDLVKYQLWLITNHGENPYGWKTCSTSSILWSCYQTKLEFCQHAPCGTGDKELRSTNGISGTDNQGYNVSGTSSLPRSALTAWPMKCLHWICCFSCLVKCCQNHFHFFFKPVPPSHWRCLIKSKQSDPLELGRTCLGEWKVVPASDSPFGKQHIQCSHLIRQAVSVDRGRGLVPNTL